MLTPMNIFPFQVLPLSGGALSYTVASTGVIAVIGGMMEISNIDSVVHYFTVTHTPKSTGVAAVLFPAVAVQPTGNAPSAYSVPKNLLPGDVITVYADVAAKVNFGWDGQVQT